MTYRAFFHPMATRYPGYRYGWRFSDARSVTAATSDCALAGGALDTRCHGRCQTPTES
jgi:hypothetical protein